MTSEEQRGARGPQGDRKREGGADIDPAKVRGVVIRVECWHCGGSGRVRAGKQAYERNGEMVWCPVCDGSQTTRKFVTLSILYDLLFGNLRSDAPTAAQPARRK